MELRKDQVPTLCMPRWVALMIILITGMLLQHNSPSSAFQVSSTPPISPSINPTSSCITIIPDGSMLLVTNPDSDTVSLVDTATHSLVSEIRVGIEPRSISISNDGLQAYVSNKGSDSLMVIDIPTRQVVHEIEIGDQPVGVIVSPDGQYLVVAESGEDQIQILDITKLETVRVFEVGDRPYGLAYSPDNRHILVSHLLSGDVTVLTYPDYVTFLPITEKHGLRQAALSPKEAGSGLPWAIHGKVIPTWQKVAPAPVVIIN